MRTEMSVTGTFKESSPKLAKLLSDEDVKVVHKNYKTASFNLRTRTLKLPYFDNSLSDDTYTMMIGHEVGHALWTPLEGWHNAKKEVPGCPRSFINIVEDIRIEKLIKRKYPGMYGIFIEGYKQLLDLDFFGLSKVGDISHLGFMNRLNICTKCGDILDVPFSKEELPYLELALAVETFEDVLEVCKRLLKFVKEQDLKNKTLDSSSDVSEETTSEHMSHENTFTDDVYRKKEAEAHNNSEVARVSVTKAFEIQKLRKGNLTEADKKNALSKFRKKYNPLINYMVSKFNQRKAAQNLAKSQFHKTGSIDPERLFSYKTEDDIFKSVEVVERQKNHGGVYFVDWSGSMRGLNIQVVAIQCALISEFCRKTKIPFEVYTWTGSVYTEVYKWISSQDSKEEYTNNLSTLLKVYETGEPFKSRSFSGTPGLDAKKKMANVCLDFREKYKIDKLHAMFLTDGHYSSGKESKEFVLQFPKRNDYIVTSGYSIYEESALDTFMREISDTYIGYYLKDHKGLRVHKNRSGYHTWFELGNEFFGSAYSNFDAAKMKTVCEHFISSIC